MNVKKFLIRFYSGVSLGLVSSRLTVLALNNFNNTIGWVLAAFGSIAFGFSEALK